MFDFTAEDCNRALVWENHPVQASVSASSEFSGDTSAEAAYIDGFLRSWRPKTSSTLDSDFIQVDFHSVARVNKLQVRAGLLACSGYVEEFKLLYSLDPRYWNVYSKDGVNPTVKLSFYHGTFQTPI